MPHQETAFRRDYVIYWENVQRPGRYGQPRISSSTPVQVKVRWDTRQTLARDAQGKPVTLDAMIVAAQEFVVGSVVMHETLEYFVGTGSAEEPLDLYEVITNDKTADIKNRGQAYVIGLAKYKGDLPEVVS